ncbi:hypothetical protein HU200_035657 [Digitaria exilis]|uniref:RING-type E3 ubiquitin transferase n=1 Tax=Digitaria exilis TaxID=1010633 RepID=A0A835BFB4_9POAL|nr:hypothetical protein HU200_035657 [Digitaria exilis]
MEANGRAEEAQRWKEAGNVAYRKHFLETAVEFYTRGALLDPSDVSFLTNRAAAFLLMGKLLEEYGSEEKLEKVDEAERWRELLEDQKRLALEAADRHRERGIRDRAQCCISLGHLPQGFKDAEKCVELDPAFLEVYVCKAKVQFLMENYKNALETYLEGLRCDPNNLEVLDGLMSGDVDLEDFEKMLVAILRRVRHPHLVTLFGACSESSSLVYEFLPNGSLEDFLLCEEKRRMLPWRSRIRIIAEICSVLIFLHKNKPHPVVHGDLKPANILLDANLVSKLTDFGISRALIQSSTNMSALHCITDPVGTALYMEPDFLTTGELTPHSDVYSFGIVVLRMLTGKPPGGIKKIVEDAMEKGDLNSVVDTSAGEWPDVHVQQLAHLAISCTESRRSRPDPSGEDVMDEPHFAADGFTYEGEAIRCWLSSGHDTSPMTNLPLGHSQLTPNYSLRSAIQEWLQQQRAASF